MSSNSILNCSGIWTGAISDTKATVKASVSIKIRNVRLLVSDDVELSRPRFYEPFDIWSDPKHEYENMIAVFKLDDLNSDTPYFYAPEFDGSLYLEKRGNFRTFPKEGEKADFKFALASCSGNDKFYNISFPDPEPYRVLMKEENLRFFFHLGDLHYGDIEDADLVKRLRKYDWLLSRSEPGELFRSLPIAYSWDDHDFVGDELTRKSPEFEKVARSALEAYRIYVPHYDLANREYGIYQSFVIGRVLFLVTDTRFNMSQKNSNNSPGTVLGEEQKSWLKGKLLEGKENFDLVVWANTIPWIGEAKKKRDYWAGFDEERREIASFIKNKEVRNLCMISGDAHMLAIDDGSNSGYAGKDGDGGRGGFPVFHAAAIESRPSRKGGPYSIGSKEGGSGRGISGRRQYGLFEVVYPRDREGRLVGAPHIFWTGRKAKRGARELSDVKDLISYNFPADKTYSGF